MSNEFQFIVNPAAGKKTRLSVIAAIESFCRGRGLRYELQLTHAPGEATRLARSVAKSGTVVVAVGGDGTVNEVANGLVGTGATLGLLPTGSGNDFSNLLRIPHQVDRALRVLVEGTSRLVDLGTVNGKLHFINAASIGFDAAVADGMRRYAAVSRGFVAYLLSALTQLLRYQFCRAVVTVDGREAFAGEFFFAAVCNGTTYGGGFRVAPEARIDDGLFTVCIVERTTRWYALTHIPKFISGRHISLPPVHMLTGREVVVRTTAPVAIQLDGEVQPASTDFTVKIRHQHLSVLMPSAVHGRV